MVDADQSCARRDGGLRLAFVVHLDQGREPAVTSRGEQLAETWSVERRNDQQHGVGAGRPRLENLPVVGYEILAEDRQIRVRARGFEVGQRPPE